MSTPAVSIKEIKRMSRNRIRTTVGQLIAALQDASDDDLLVIAAAARILAENGNLEP